MSCSERIVPAGSSCLAIIASPAAWKASETRRVAARRVSVLIRAGGWIPNTELVLDVDGADPDP